MKLHRYLKQLRTDLQLSQEAFGAQGFVSTPGWIKIENGQRDPSEKLIGVVARFVIKEKVDRKAIFKKDADAAQTALEKELLTLKYLGSKSQFLRDLAKGFALTLPNGAALLEVPKLPQVISRGRPRGSGKAKAPELVAADPTPSSGTSFAGVTKEPVKRRTKK